MAHEDQKDFNAMLHDDRGMPRYQTVTDPVTIQKYGGGHPGLPRQCRRS